MRAVPARRNGRVQVAAASPLGGGAHGLAHLLDGADVLGQQGVDAHPRQHLGLVEQVFVGVRLAGRRRDAACYAGVRIDGVAGGQRDLRREAGVLLPFTGQAGDGHPAPVAPKGVGGDDVRAQVQVVGTDLPDCVGGRLVGDGGPGTMSPSLFQPRAMLTPRRWSSDPAPPSSRMFWPLASQSVKLRLGTSVAPFSPGRCEADSSLAWTGALADTAF